VSRAHDLRLAELIGALSLATDLGSGQPMERSLRRCLLAVGLGAAVGLDQDQLNTTYYASLLQYVGCTTEAHEIAATWSDEIAAGDWFAEIASGQASEAIAAILRLHGAAVGQHCCGPHSRRAVGDDAAHKSDRHLGCADFRAVFARSRGT
jgi:hypothetical protein